MSIFKQAIPVSFWAFILILTASSFTFESINNGSLVSMHMKIRSHQKGKMIRIEANLYYDIQSGRLVSQYQHPEKYIMLSNRLGETSVYYEDKNEVISRQANALSTENKLLFFFLNAEGYDMGLNDLGFKKTESDFEDGLMISWWTPPESYRNQISKVKMVHEDFLPIYTEYIDHKGNVSRKIFYDHFQNVYGKKLPGEITEFSYLPDGDSIISKTDYSEIKTGAAANHYLFNFKVPENAKRIK